MEMEEREGRAGGEDEGRKVTRSDGESDRGVGVGVGWGKRMSGVGDAADPPV